MKVMVADSQIRESIRDGLERPAGVIPNAGPSDNKWASASAAFGRSGATGASAEVVTDGGAIIEDISP